jgi:hypothetical protein
MTETTTTSEPIGAEGKPGESVIKHWLFKGPWSWSEWMREKTKHYNTSLLLHPPPLLCPPNQLLLVFCLLYIHYVLKTRPLNDHCFLTLLHPTSCYFLLGHSEPLLLIITLPWDNSPILSSYSLLHLFYPSSPPLHFLPLTLIFESTHLCIVFYPIHSAYQKSPVKGNCFLTLLLLNSLHLLLVHSEKLFLPITLPLKIRANINYLWDFCQHNVVYNH